MAMKIIWSAVLFFVGWIGYYLFGRQLIFNFKTAFPLIRQMRKHRKT